MRHQSGTTGFSWSLNLTEAQLCLDPVMSNQSLLRKVHRGCTTNNIFPKLTHMHCITLIDASMAIIISSTDN